MSLLLFPFRIWILLIVGQYAPPHDLKNPDPQGFIHIRQSDSALVGRFWKLTELMGQPLDEKDPKRAGFLFLTKDGHLQASAGCNRLGGTYHLMAMQKIEIGKDLVSTLMACPNAEKEERFKKVLTGVNTYSLKADTLTVTRNKMAPMARFVDFPGAKP